jgi:hypothetical protein
VILEECSGSLEQEHMEKMRKKRLLILVKTYRVRR